MHGLTSTIRESEGMPSKLLKICPPADWVNLETRLTENYEVAKLITGGCLATLSAPLNSSAIQYYTKLYSQLQHMHMLGNNQLAKLTVLTNNVKYLRSPKARIPNSFRSLSVNCDITFPIILFVRNTSITCKKSKQLYIINIHIRSLSHYQSVAQLAQ